MVKHFDIVAVALQWLLPKLETSYPLLFIFQCAYFIIATRKFGPKNPTFFSDLLVALSASTLAPIIFFSEVPGWLGKSKYFLTFFLVWAVVISLLSIIPRVMKSSLVHTLLCFGMLASISHIVMNSLARTLITFQSNTIIICYLVAFATGCGTHFIFFHGKNTQIVMDSIRVEIVTFFTATLYLVLRKPSLFAIHAVKFSSFTRLSLKAALARGETFSYAELPSGFEGIMKKYRWGLGELVDVVTDYATGKRPEPILTISSLRQVIPFCAVGIAALFSFVAFITKRCCAPTLTQRRRRRNYKDHTD